MLLSDGQLRSFISDGYLILREAVPIEKVRTALSLTDEAYEQNPSAPWRNIRGHPTLTSLYEHTDLRAQVDQLLQPGNARLRTGAPQIAYTGPEGSGSGRSPADNITLKDPHPNDKWHIDASHGKYAALGADFLLLVGIALSDGQHIDENRGQLVVFPGMSRHTFKKVLFFACTASRVIRICFFNFHLTIFDTHVLILK